MAQSGTRETEHETTVSAPARQVYDLIADVDYWPRMFPPTVHAEQIECGEGGERIRIWATANGEAKGWTSWRTLDPGRMSVGFRQEVSQPPVAAMGGEWRVEELDPGRCRVVLLHDFRAVGDDPEKIVWIEKAIDRNSGSELGALKTAAERRHDRSELELTFEDTVRVDGDPQDLYEFVYAAGLWQERLPHVVRVRLEEATPNLQTLEMDTRAPNGSEHTTRSIRVCFTDERIVYKQLVTPALMTVHTGAWTFGTDGGQAVITSGHTVVLNPDNVTTVLGDGATLDDARAFVRDALGKNSTATMNHAKTHAEEITRTAGSGRA